VSSRQKTKTYSKVPKGKREGQHSNQDLAAKIGPRGAPSGSESQLTPGLYVTATPIGNASDITLRALDVLAHCDAIIVEDTRVTSRLLAIHGIRRPLLSYNEHNAPRLRPKILKRLREGGCLALVSDAGTPLVSDPGHKLVREAVEAGGAVHAIPGPSAALAALSSAGLPTDRFFFTGFLPAKRGERRSALRELKGIPATLIFFEAPQRLSKTLVDMAEILGAREVAVMRELTKLYEEVRRGTLIELSKAYEEAPPKGEITIIVSPALRPESDLEAQNPKIDRLLMQALDHMPIAAATTLVVDATGSRKRTVYTRALALKEKVVKLNKGQSQQKKPGKS
jgi:16S rRNA (cytidine1402-2'-O)-methyltransferase